jgi:ABC-type Co2+ transport system permease subunit
MFCPTAGGSCGRPTGGGSGGGTLTGSLTATAVAGVATFSNLTLQKAATGYKLAVATPNATGAASNAFDVAAGAPVQFQDPGGH